MRYVANCWIALIVVGGPMIETAAATPFVTETVVPNVDPNEGTSLVLDAQGNPRITYYDAGTERLMYAVKSGPSWALETVDAAGAVGLYSSLALDAQGDPHVGYYDVTKQDLKYARKSGGLWIVEIVDLGGNVGDHTSLALDAAGNPHISYRDNSTNRLKYASKNGGVWTTEFPDPGSNRGLFSSLALDASGTPHISYLDAANNVLVFAHKRGGSWTIEFVEGLPSGSSTSLVLDERGTPHISHNGVGELRYSTKSGPNWVTEAVTANSGTYDGTSLALDTDGNPRISFHHASTRVLKLATRNGSSWTVETVDHLEYTGVFSSLAPDAQGNPCISYFDWFSGGLKYADSRVRMTSPSGGETWPVGSLRDIVWSGAGPVDVSLSSDGGATYDRLLQGVHTSPIQIRVPHTPTKFARMKIERASPLSTSLSGGLFTIEGSVALLSFTARPAPEGGADLSWASNPGPADLAGYRLERGDGVSYQTIVPLTSETSYMDRSGPAGARYRLFSVNGLGEELLLGEAALLPARALAAWPLPYRGGSLSISFAAAGARGGGPGETSVELFDISGRRLRSIARGRFASGHHSVTWDGLDDRGMPVVSGLYFLRATTLGETAQIKLLVMP